MRLAVVGLFLLAASATHAQDGLRLYAIAEAEPVVLGDLLLDISLDAIETVGREEVEDGSSTVTVWLRGEHAADLARVTGAVAGQRIAVVHRGEVLAAPRVESAVPNGLVMIHGLRHQDAERLAARLRGEPEPIPISTGSDSLQPPIRPPLDGVPPPSGTPTSDPRADLGAEAGALAFVSAIERRAWAEAADRLHPDAHAALGPDALGLLHLDGETVWVRDGLSEGRFPLSSVLPGARVEAVDRLSARDRTALYLAGLDALGVWGPPSPPRTVVGQIQDGDATHVLLRARDGAEAGASAVTVVTMRRDATGNWRALLTDARGF